MKHATKRAAKSTIECPATISTVENAITMPAMTAKPIEISLFFQNGRGSLAS